SERAAGVARSQTDIGLKPVAARAEIEGADGMDDAPGRCSGYAQGISLRDRDFAWAEACRIANRRGFEIRGLSVDKRKVALGISSGHPAAQFATRRIDQSEFPRTRDVRIGDNRA